MSDGDIHNQVLALQKENLKLSRQLIRLQATIERNSAAAAVAANITAIQTAEKRKQEHYMWSILKNSPNIILLLDKQLYVAYCTQKTLDATGIAHFIDITGQHYREFFKLLAEPDWFNVIEAKINEAVLTGLPWTTETVFNVKDLGARCCIVQFVPQTGADMEGGGSMIAIHDVTDIRQMQEEAENARKQAEQASIAKSMFLSSMSHEIRTPMNAIIGMTAIGIASDSIAKKEYCLSKIDEASKHLLGIINDVLDMSKIEANKFKLSYDVAHVETMVKKIANFIAFKVEERSHDFTVQIDPLIPAMIETDDQRLIQVVTNLLSNAVKFTPDGGKIKLSIELISEDSEGCTIRIAVSDSGIGISPEQQSRLFQSFEQADNTTSRKFGGTGLGLAISKKIVNMMGGQLWVESEIGNGATFFCEIKAKRRSAENARGFRRDVTLENTRLLVVDDSEDVLAHFTHVTEKLHIKCDVAISGARAYELIDENGGYDVYFIDMYMPDMSGIELTKRIKQRAGANPPVCIMISSQEWHIIESEARDAGIDHYLQKPIHSSAIVDCLNRYINVPGGIDRKHVMLEGIFENKHILLADDVIVNREVVKAQLAITKIDIDCVENGREAVRMFTENPDKYDMIFMDIQMPEMDGLAATRAIRALEIPEAKTIAIVAMTANVFREDVQQCLEAGMDDHVGKPLDIATVVEKIKRYARKLPFPKIQNSKNA